MGFDYEQQRAYDIGISGENQFISGMAGVGKTYVLKKIIQYWREQGKKVIVCAYTKRAAINIDDAAGMTIFEAFNAYPQGLVFDQQGLKRLSKSPAWNADVIIVDEISMCPKSLFSYICMAIRRISYDNNYKWISLIVSGDFLQLPPIARLLFSAEYAFESNWWDKAGFRYSILETPHRHPDREYFEHLCQIRFGEDIGNNLRYIMNHAFYLQERPDTLTLCSYRDDVRKKNLAYIDRLPGEPRFFEARTNSEAYMKGLGVWNLLTLKEGTLVMTTVNDPLNRYYNGATGHIVGMNEDAVVVEFSDSTREKEHIETISYRRWMEDDKYVEQLPIIPAYSLTIHKSQGCTVDYLNVDPTCFAEGQLYVALSRVQNVKHLYITKEIKAEHFKVNQKAVEFYKRCCA